MSLFTDVHPTDTTQTMKTGDVVRLRSGGPLMTVDERLIEPAQEAGEVRCIWFEGDEVKRGTFPAAALIEVPKEKLPAL